MSKARDIADSAATINVLDGVTATATELNYVDGVTSAIQTQLDGKETADATIVKDADIGSTVQAYDSNLTSFVGTFTLPTSDGTADQVLTTNGSGVLSFGAGGSVAALNLTLISGHNFGDTSASSVSWTGLDSTYDYHLLVTNRVDAGQQNPVVHLSTNNGSTYNVDIADINQRAYSTRGSPSWQGENDTSNTRIFTNSGDVIAYTYIVGLGRNAEVKFSTIWHSFENSSNFGFQVGRCNNTATHNAMRYQIGGTSSQGSIYLYGVTI